MASRVVSLVSPSLHGSLDDSESFYSDMASLRNLSDVPEEGTFTPTSSHPNSPYLTAGNPAALSTSTFHGSSSGAASAPGAGSSSRSSGGSRKPSSARSLGRSSADHVPSASVKRSPSGSAASSTKDGKVPKPVGTLQKIRSTPRLPHDKDAEPAPSSVMYWSRAPVYGTIPMRTMRAHSVTLVDTTAWLFGGCDDKDCSKDIYCFDTGMSHECLRLLS